jgi:predicted short-subunit dehydrogenase-like oxidoreductase (DUF2520 family)
MMYKIALIGAGNVAWHLSRALEMVGHRITEVHSRQIANAQLLVKQLYDATPTQQLNLLDTAADLVLIAVPDKAISEVVEKLQVPFDVIVAHTSGTQSIDLLAKFGDKAAVFYPLQTFTKTKQVDFTKVPICIEAKSEATLDLLGDIATSLSEEVYQLTSAQRQVLHLSAVVACNFANHLWAISKEILDQADMDFELLHPLIVETTEKALQMPPKDAQTGPAKRGDKEVLQKHLELLKEMPHYQKIYQLMTESIISMHQA